MVIRPASAVLLGEKKNNAHIQSHQVIPGKSIFYKKRLLTVIVRSDQSDMD
jgi:hypothetical protein